MADVKALGDKKKLTELCVNPNTVVNNSPERSQSRVIENISGEHTGARCFSMGASFQASRGTIESLKAQKMPPKQNDSYPSSLRSTSTSCNSYSLEISTTTVSHSDKESTPRPLKTPSESRDGQIHEAVRPSPLVNEMPPSVTKSYRLSDSKPLEEKQRSSETKFSQFADTFGTSEIITPKSTSLQSGLETTFLSGSSGNGKLEAQPMSTNQPHTATSTGKCHSSGKTTQTNQEEGSIFYAFVILHAQEDTAEALRLKSKLESISSTTGATFTEDFAVPGQSMFRCVEDAIENSAFVMLLLTQNFNTHLNEANADSALMNSIENPHKFNSVIPLLPRINGLTRDQMPLLLKTKNPLDETKDSAFFEKMVKKVLDSRNLQRQKSLWRDVKLRKKQQEKKLHLQDQERYLRKMIQESAKIKQLEEQVQQLKMQQQRLPPPNAHQPNSSLGFPGRPQPFDHMPFLSSNSTSPYNSGNMWPQQPSNIHIHDARCIMIGNNSTMTVGACVDSGDEENF